MWRVNRAGSLLSAAVAAAAASPGCDCEMKARRPEPTAEVREALAEVDAAFAAAEADPRTFRRAAVAALPRLRGALEAWHNRLPRAAPRGVVRGWMIEAGAIETSVSALPAGPTPEQCRPIAAAWRNLRGEMP